MVWLPREIFDLIAKGLGPNSFKIAASAQRFHEGDENLPWRAIFDNDQWIDQAYEVGANPALICADFASLSHRSQGQCYMLLIDHDWDGDLYLNEGPKLLFRSLRKDHIYDREQHCVNFPAKTFEIDGRPLELPKIKLNIYNPTIPSDTIQFPDKAIRTLFRKNPFRTEYTFARDRRIRTAESEHIYGLGGRLLRAKSRVPICIIYLPEEQQRPYVLQEASCPEVTHIIGVNDMLLGWRRT